MTPIVAYIKEVASKAGLNQNELAEKLGVKPSGITGYLKKGIVPNDITCERLAELSGDPVEKVLLLAAESRAPEGTREAWHNIFKKAGYAAALALVLTASAIPSPAKAASVFSDNGGMDIMSNKKRRRRTRPLRPKTPHVRPL